MSITLEQINQVLIDTGAFIVHCAGYAKGVGFTEKEVGYLERISKVIAENPPISCSSVQAGDSANMRLTGEIGVILVPNNRCSISHASPEDAGTSVEDRNISKDQNLTVSLSELENAIKNRVDNSYNELCLYNYDVCGIFYTKLPVEFAYEPTQDEINAAIENGGEIINSREFNSIDINNMNSVGLPVYQFINGDFYLTSFDGHKYIKGGSPILVTDVLKI